MPLSIGAENNVDGLLAACMNGSATAGVNRVFLFPQSSERKNLTTLHYTWTQENRHGQRQYAWTKFIKSETVVCMSR
ncbi:hypothetical protein LIER_33086 [Lithospermum erythrorhizon]|uniref:Uncharacterized protein n=1 Tax=Lithospermum erythrorhizon TaxID=34254 RepID=A0AAV3RXE8_LITER